VFNLTFRSEYRYDATNPKGIEIPIELCHGGESVRLMAKVDTGAASCIFHRAYAEELGIEVEKGQREIFSTATSNFEAYGHKLELACFESKIELIVFFAVSLAFDRNVLGRDGWLQGHRIGIVDYSSTIFISHHSD
jgi:hypothetical protein